MRKNGNNKQQASGRSMRHEQDSSSTHGKPTIGVTSISLGGEDSLVSGRTNKRVGSSERAFR